MSYRILKDEKNYYAQVECPGYKREEIDISIQKDHLIIKGDRRKRLKEEESKYNITGSYSPVWMDSLYGRRATYEFQRDFYMDVDALDRNSIDAKIEDGILTITIPLKEASVPKKIVISA